MTSETQSMSVPNAASKTLSRKYSPPNQSGKIANATRSAASIQPEMFFAEFIFKRSQLRTQSHRTTAILERSWSNSTYGNFS
jgi:hypothetical protein